MHRAIMAKPTAELRPSLISFGFPAMIMARSTRLWRNPVPAKNPLVPFRGGYCDLDRCGHQQLKLRSPHLTTVCGNMWAAVGLDQVFDRIKAVIL